MGAKTNTEDITIVRPTDDDVEELIADVEDVTDPSSVDKVLEFIEYIIDSDEIFMQLLTEKVGDAEITWDQPWYQSGFHLTRKTIYDHEDDKESGPIHSGTITTEERERIDKNWAKFRKKYKLPDGLICVARWRNRLKAKNPKCCPEEKARRYLIAYLARGLQRTMNRVFKFIRVYYGTTRRGTNYTPTEDKIIKICYLHKPNLNGSMIANALGRDPRGVYRKLLAFNKPEPTPRKRLKWNLSLATTFLQLLMKYTRCELDELKNLTIEKDVWLQLENDMDQNYEYLKQFWYGYLHVQLFVRCDVKLLKLQKRLFKILRKSSYRVWPDIRWKEVATNFPDGFTPRFLYKVCFRRVKPYKKNYIKTPLKEIAEYALERIKSRRKLRNKRLKTLRLNKEGQLQWTDYRYEYEYKH